MSSSNAEKMVPVTSYDTLLSDGTRVAWQSFRPAKSEPTDNPTLYTTTLAADPDDDGNTSVDLYHIGAQAVGHSVVLTLVSGTATVELPGNRVQALEPGEPFTLPAKGENDAALLSFSTQICSLQLSPQWPTFSGDSAAKGLMRTSGGGGEQPPPPPPTPGGTGNN